MRIISFLAPSSKQAIANLRESLGDDAIILTTRTLEDGQVSVTGAVSEDAYDLVDVLTPSEAPQSLNWLSALTEFHEWSFQSRERIEPVLQTIKPTEPEIVLTALMQALFRFVDLPLEGKRPLMFSGPPGSGKTVSIAKLAAVHVLAGSAVDILTMDVGRAGSLDQLTTLLAPLELVPRPVATPADLPKLVAACRGDIVLVDSVGVNPFNPADLAAISTFVTQAGAELILVMPAGQGYADSAEIAQSYAALGARSMLVTKLDTARRCGGILAAAEAGLAFTQAGTGPTIGNGLCQLSADGLARLLLRRYRSSIGEETL